MDQLPVEFLDPESGTDGQVPVISGGQFVIGTPGSGLDAEAVRDIIAAALVQGAGVTITVNDAGDTITIAGATTFLAHVTTTNASGDFVDVWTDEGNHLYVEESL